LSPCYDMVATVSWPEFGWDRKIAPHLSLSLGKEKSFAELDRRCLEKFAQRSGQSDAVDLFMHSLERARLAWRAWRSGHPSAWLTALFAIGVRFRCCEASAP